MKCRKIQKGSCFGIICPSSRCKEPATIERFLNYLTSLGFKYKVGETVNAVYSPDSLVQIVTNVVENWANKPDAENIEVILNSNDVELLELTFLK